MNKIDFNKIMECELEKAKNLPQKPTLCLHSCCAPCSSSVLQRLLPFFDVSIFYFNPNIHPKEEYEKRKSEQMRYANFLGINIIDCDYNPQLFFNNTNGFEKCKEGGERCKLCYKLRIDACAQYAKNNNFQYFCTTLSVSPHKNCEWINELGIAAQAEFGVKFLQSDFKKKDGYLNSIKLSKEHNFYRQSYCGCVFSQTNRNE